MALSPNIMTANISDYTVFGLFVCRFQLCLLHACNNYDRFYERAYNSFAAYSWNNDHDT